MNAKQKESSESQKQQEEYNNESQDSQDKNKPQNNNAHSLNMMEQLIDEQIGDKAAKQKISKKQLKKAERKQKWQQIKKQKRKEQRQKQKLKKKLKREQQMKKKQQMPSANQNQNQQKKQEQNMEVRKKRKDEYKQKMLDGQKVVIDLQFYDLMTQKQQSSLGKQLAYCHSVNRKFQKSFNFIITSATQPRLKFLDDKYNIVNYGIIIEDKDILNLFSKDKLVYLTGDAQQELKEFNEEQVYIIGGIVDHNRLKNITINYANQNGIKARRLPMEGLRLKASVHLAVNHVWEWMLRFYNGFTWKQAIKAVIPERKLQQQQEAQQLNPQKQQHQPKKQ